MDRSNEALLGAPPAYGVGDNRVFQFNNPEKTTVNLAGFTLDSVSECSVVSGCFGFIAGIFCSSCLRPGAIRLILKNTAQPKQYTMHKITYEDLETRNADFERIAKFFSNNIDRPQT